MAKAAEYSIILFFGNLSAKNPAGEKTKIKGNKTRALTMAVKTICVEPS